MGRFTENAIGPNGKPTRKQRAVVIGPVSEMKTAREARAKFDGILRPINLASGRPTSIVTFRQLAEQWRNAVLPSMKASTAYAYRLILDNVLLPYWGGRELGQIKRLDIQRFVSDYLATGKHWQTVRNHFSVLSGLLTQAVEWDYLQVNPARGVRFPERPRTDPPRILGKEEFEKLLTELNEPFRTAVILVALTGIRAGELCALSWGAVTWDEASQRGYLHVERNAWRGEFQTVKTKAGNRALAFGPQVNAAIEEHRARSLHTDANDLLFPAIYGSRERPISYEQLREVLVEAGKRAGLGKVGWHQLRHCHTSILHSRGIPDKVIQERLGHADVRTTQRIYTHSISEDHFRAAVEIEKVFFPSLPKEAASVAASV